MRAESHTDYTMPPQRQAVRRVALSESSANNPLTGHPASRLPTAADISAAGPVPAEISPRADIGHVNLTVSDLECAVVFYRDVIGLRVTQRDEDSAFLAAGGYHHHVALNRWDPEAKPPPPRTTGLHHFGLRLPDRTALAAVVVRLVRAGHPLLGATDHGVNLAVYLADPDGNGLELMVDQPAADWPRKPDGSIAMTVAPFDVAALVADAFSSDSLQTESPSP
jgi:catechol 2,3-dioxygenase